MNREAIKAAIVGTIIGCVLQAAILIPLQILL